MNKLRKILSRKPVFSKPVYAILLVAQTAFILSSTYWLGRSDEINELLDILKTSDGDVTLKFWNKEKTKKVPVHIHLVVDEPNKEV